MNHATPIIEIKNLGKRYDIAHQRGGYIALRDVLANVVKNPFSFLKSKAKKVVGLEKKEAFWALKDISFDVMPGEVIGVIGKNGAGKSTLLKILTGITPPTEGEAIMRGRVSSLLEVGTGFHPELTGRENIFLNGAILGMTRKEIAQKFDEIVEFSGVGKFLDTPVKHYSSGMQVRLAFSVAAHMEPDILIVDEVLAVGDAEFQKKSMGKMEEVTKKDGRTILFVSHNMGAVAQLCSKTIWIDGGKVKRAGETGMIIKAYLSASKDSGSEKWENTGRQFENDYFKPEKFYISREQDGTPWVNIEATVKKLDPTLTIGYALFTEENNLLYWSYQTDSPERKWPTLKLGRCSIKSRLPVDMLNEGFFKIEMLGGLHNKEWLFPPNKPNPTITLSLVRKFDQSIYWTQKRPGLLAPIIEWTNKES